MFRIYARALLAIALFCPPAFSQGDITEVVKKLAGENQRTWTYKGVEMYTGQKAACHLQSLTFYQDNRVIIKKCERGMTVNEERSWSLKRISPLDISLRIGNEEYLLLFSPIKPESNRQEMILRLKPPNQVKPTTDYIYYRKVS